MSGRGGVRSSARLSGDAAAEAPLQRGRPPATSAAAAQRRARAAERAREVEDSAPVLRAKCRKLARALRNAKHLVVYTGAGISTAAAIPDYRGPAGVWTRLRRGEPVRRVEVSRARPTYTHMALSALWARGALKFVVSQNCDGLHVRAGLPRRALAELHGDMFVELCAPCRRVYLRAFDTTERTARHRHATRRLCHACGAELRDSIVHFGERGRAAWPLNWAGALRHAARADVVLCLGSSLKVLRRYPRLWRMHAPPRRRPQLYIVNLQWTPKDAVAALKINARCDAVMRLVARRLRLRVPRYRAARDPLLAHAEPLAAPEAHTTTRPLLRTDLLSDDSSSSDDSLTSDSLSSSSASDSDEELPLRRLADRLRTRDSLASVTSPPPPPRGSPDRLRDSPSTSDRLHAFQVRLQSGDATVLLRAEHVTGPRRLTAALRSFRRVCVPRPPPARHGPEPQDGDKLAHTNGSLGLGSRLRRLLEYEPRIDAHDNGKIPPPEFLRRAQFGPNGARILPKREPKEETKTEPKDEPKAERRDEAREEGSSSSEGSEGAGGLAAAIIRRAVLVCRASLYPGLHSMVAPPAAAECAWCARYYRAARCLWYGAPRAPPPPARAWRRVRARRYLCACCPRDAAPPPHDTGGWYGKGYRKGRRR